MKYLESRQARDQRKEMNLADIEYSVGYLSPAFGMMIIGYYKKNEFVKAKTSLSSHQDVRKGDGAIFGRIITLGLIKQFDKEAQTV